MSDHSQDRGEGPDSEMPDLAFRDGDSRFEVSVSPASFPTRLVAVPTTGGFTDALFEMAVGFFGGLVARLVDRRWKVTAIRAGVNARVVTWRVGHAELFVDREAAEIHQTNVLDNWLPGAMADLPRMSFSDMRSLRLTTKG